MGLTGKKVPQLLLTIAVISALITAISGFFLGSEVPAKGDLLFWHQWLGGGVALLAALWYALSQMRLNQKRYTKAVQVVLVGLVVATGHYGGMVTHGEEFLALPTKKRQKKIPENSLIYKDIVTRIMDDKCVSCHNPNKRKGELILTDMGGLLKGGESGNALIPGKPEESELIKRLHLPKDHEDHMPPEGKIPLTEDEIAILERWIALGASDTVQLDQLGSEEPLVGMVRKMMASGKTNSWAKLPKVADSTLQNLASDYITINRISSNSQALSISVFLPPNYEPNHITDLKRISNNIIQLDLSGIPIGEQEMDLVAQCKNLEWLELDKTPITDTELNKLTGLDQLSMLKVYGTGITDQSISILKNLKGLKSLYVWETQISDAGFSKLKESSPQLQLNHGIDQELKASFIEKDSLLF